MERVNGAMAQCYNSDWGEMRKVKRGKCAGVFYNTMVQKDYEWWIYNSIQRNGENTTNA